MMMSNKCFERVLFDFCDKFASILEENAIDAECMGEYHKIAIAINDIYASFPSRFGYMIEMADIDEVVYELEVLDSDEETTLHATKEDAEACAPDGSAYLIHNSEPRMTFRVVDFFGNELVEGELYASYREAIIAILRECVPEWQVALQHLKDVSQPIMFTPEWEEELKQQIRVEEALAEGAVLADATLEANYVNHLILSARQVV